MIPWRGFIAIRALSGGVLLLVLLAGSGWALASALATKPTPDLIAMASAGKGFTPPPDSSVWLDVELYAHSGSSYMIVHEPLSSASVANAPATAPLAQSAVPAGSYKSAVARLNTGSGKVLASSRIAGIEIKAGQLTPLLVVLGEARGGVLLRGLYAGTLDVNLGLQVAAGTALTVPSVPLETAAGAPFSFSSQNGHPFLVISFITECQETCPIAMGQILALRNELAAQGLLGRVPIFALTQDPADDTPHVLQLYQKMTQLPFTFLTGTVANVDLFWQQLHVPPIQRVPWGKATAPLFFATGKPEPYNIIHASVVVLADGNGAVVHLYEGQPTALAPLPAPLHSYLDSQGVTELSQQGSWTYQDVDTEVRSLLALAPAPAPSVITGSGPGGSRLPGFTLSSLAGGQVSLSGVLGHEVVLSFFATWCTACRAELPALVRTVAAAPGRPILLLIDDGDSATSVHTFLSQLGISHAEVLLDRNQRVSGEYGISGLPVTIFINAKGRQVRRFIGEMTPADMQAGLQAAA